MSFLQLEGMDTLVNTDTRLVVELRHPRAIAPNKANSSDACFDLASPSALRIAVGATQAVDLGLAIELEPGWEAQIRGRSGLASRGIVVHQGTIDHLYRQNLKVLIHNLSGSVFTIEPGDRIAQMKIDKVYAVDLEVGRVTPTERGGLGSTGR